MLTEVGAGEPVKRQVAALPFVARPNGSKVLLVTTLNSCRWIPPKGWIDEGLAPHEIAAREAFEEAGAVGEVAEMPIGSFDYLKRHKNAQTSLCRVDVFPMRVTRLLGRWPERTRRTRRWFTPDAASRIVDEPSLALILFRFAALAPMPAERSGDPIFRRRRGEP